VLREIRRVLEPGGLLVLTVPRRHLFSWLDPKPVSYRRDWLVGRLQEHGFAITRESGANLFWRWFQIPRLLAGPRLRQLLDRVIWIDGQFFDRANLFLSARVIS
jgi:SAM-dependent methyltransferase